MSEDLDRRTLDRMYEADPRWRDIPEDKLKRTFAFASCRLNTACRDLGHAILSAIGLGR